MLIAYSSLDYLFFSYSFSLVIFLSFVVSPVNQTVMSNSWLSEKPELHLGVESQAEIQKVSVAADMILFMEFTDRKWSGSIKLYMKNHVLPFYCLFLYFENKIDSHYYDPLFKKTYLCKLSRSKVLLKIIFKMPEMDNQVAISHY